MTKPRAPLSLGAALARIAGQVPGDWAALGEEVGRHARTVRKWGDDDAEDDIAFGAALKLDILFQRHGGQGFPIYEAYGQLLDCAVAHSFTDRFEILRRARDFAQVKAGGQISQDVADAAMKMLRVDAAGFDESDRRMLLTMIENFDGGPVGVESLAAALSEERGTLEDVIEPYLIQQGYVVRSARGRMATNKAYLHLGLPAPRGRPADADLFGG